MRRGGERVPRRTARAHGLWARDCDCHLRCARRRTKRREGRCHDCRRGGCRARELDSGELLTRAGLSSSITRAGAPDEARETPEAAAPDVVAFVRLELGRDGALRLAHPRSAAPPRSRAEPSGSERDRRDCSRGGQPHRDLRRRGDCAGKDVGEPQPPAAAPSIRRARTAGIARSGAPWLELETFGAVRLELRQRRPRRRRHGRGARPLDESKRNPARRSALVRARSAIVVYDGAGDRALRPALGACSAPGESSRLPRAWCSKRRQAPRSMSCAATTVALRPTSEPRRPAFVDAVAVVDLTAGVRIALAPRPRRGRGGRGRASALLLAIRRRGRARTRPRPPLHRTRCASSLEPRWAFDSERKHPLDSRADENRT